MAEKKLPPITEWIKRSFELYFERGNLVYLTKFALLQLLLTGASFVVMFIFLFPHLGENGVPEVALMTPLLIVFLVISFIVSVVFNLWFSISTILAVGQVVSGKKLSVRETLTISRRKILSFVAVSILVGLAVLGGLILLVIPAFIFFVWFYFSQYVLVSEGLGPIAAMKRSRELVRGYFWSVGARIGVAFLIAFLINILVSLVLFPIAQVIILGLIAPYYHLLPYLLYWDLKNLKSSDK